MWSPMPPALLEMAAHSFRVSYMPSMLSFCSTSGSLQPHKLASLSYLRWCIVNGTQSFSSLYQAMHTRPLLHKESQRVCPIKIKCCWHCPSWECLFACLHGDEEAAAQLWPRCASIEESGGGMCEPPLAQVQVCSHCAVNILQASEA